MTAIQTQYQANLEAARANRANEEIRQREAAVKEGQLLETQKLTEAQVNKMVSELDKLAAEIANIQSDTALTDAQKETEVAKKWSTWLDVVGKGLDPSGLLKGFGSGLGKTLGGGLIGLA